MQPINVVFIGDGGVGKTSIINRLSGHGFAEIYSPTFGFTFLEEGIIDSSGQEKLGTDWSTLRDLDRIVIVFDLTSRISFRNIGFWIKIARREFPSAQIYLVGNKSDCHHRVNRHAIDALRDREQILYTEVSAR